MTQRTQSEVEEAIDYVQQQRELITKFNYAGIPEMDHQVKMFDIVIKEARNAEKMRNALIEISKDSYLNEWDGELTPTNVAKLARDVLKECE